MPSRAVLLLLAFLFGAVAAGWFVARAGERPVEFAAPEPAHSSGLNDPSVGSPAVVTTLDLQAVLASLQRIEERLDRLELSADRAEPEHRLDSDATRNAASEQLAAAVVRLESLERSLTEEVARRRAASEPDLAELKAEHPEEKWAALDDYMALWSRDEQAATDDLRLLTYRDILTRFGSPTEMWSNERGTHWTYGQGHDAVDGGYQREVYVRFEDGLVTTLGVK